MERENRNQGLQLDRSSDSGSGIILPCVCKKTKRPRSSVANRRYPHSFTVFNFLNMLGDVINLSATLTLIFTVGTNPALMSIMGARILFNMKELGERGLNQGTICEMRSITSEINFALPEITIAGDSTECAEESRDVNVV